MKVLLINSPVENQPVVRDMAGGLGFDGGNKVVLPPLELASMAATLLMKGHGARILDCHVDDSYDGDIAKLLMEYQPDAIISTVSLPTLYADCSFLKRLRAYSSAVMVAKTGIAYREVLKEILERSGVDICIFGECDTNIDEIIAGKEKKGTSSLEEGKLVVNENSVISDLDNLPLPARHLLPNKKYRYAFLGDEVATIQTSRGCPYPCSYYCGYPLVQGKKWRARSPEHVMLEIQDIVDTNHIKKILFRDATFTLDKVRAEKICDLMIQRNLDVEWWCETRVDCLDSRLMQKMKGSGCRGINIGVETGDQQLLERRAKIGVTLEKIEGIDREAKEVGLKIHFLLMVGLPEETRESLYSTYKFICQLKPSSIGVCVVTPYPGTRLYLEAKDRGWVETEDWREFGGHSAVMHTDHLSSQDMLKAQKMIHQGFYLSQKGLLGRIALRYHNHHFKKWVLGK